MVKSLLFLALIAAATARVSLPSCAEGGVCSAAELAAMSKTELIDHIRRMQGDNDKPLTATASGWPLIWPMPQSYTNGTKRLVLNPEFMIGGPLVSDFSAVALRYRNLIFSRTAPTPEGTVMGELTCSVSSLSADLQLGVDESYTLVIPDDGSAATITAQTVYGAYRGLETFSQLVQYDYDKNEYYIEAAPWKISDFPRFAHREVLIDSSRHFLPVPTIKNVIDALSYLKFNTIHWHIVDSQSFPMPLPSYMHFSEKGSYTPGERYTVDELKDIVAYARQRGIRIMPELDVPGHAHSWCAGDPKMCPSTTCQSPLNVANNYTFQVIEGMIREMADIFPDKVIHLGGDEVDTSCWDKVAEVKSWMDAQGMTAKDAYKYFVKRVHEIVHSVDREVAGWEEIWKNFGTDLDSRTIIHQWLRNSTIAKDAIAHGYRVFWSTSNYWYLDHLDITWQTMYTADPCSGLDDTSCNNYLIGGGGEMWGETVDTSDIMQTIFPRAAAVAERLWSAKTVNDATAAAGRYQNIRCLLNKRGVAAAPSGNAKGRTAPSGPGSCLQ